MERAVHDRGGWPTSEPIDRTEHELEDWELLTDALVGALGQAGAMNVDELRRGSESMPPDAYEHASYYERWLEGDRGTTTTTTTIRTSRSATTASRPQPRAPGRSRRCSSRRASSRPRTSGAGSTGSSPARPPTAPASWRAPGSIRTSSS